MFRKLHSQTLEIVHQDITPKYEKETKEMIQNTVKVDLDELKLCERKGKGVIKVVYQDCVDTAYELQKNGFNPLILNMGSSTIPGGKWSKGSPAQEESLFYRSNFFLGLKEELYPIMNNEVIYTPNVYIKKYRYYFDNIVFSILDFNRSNNFEIFSKELNCLD